MLSRFPFWLLSQADRPARYFKQHPLIPGDKATEDTDEHCNRTAHYANSTANRLAAGMARV